MATSPASVAARRGVGGPSGWVTDFLPPSTGQITEETRKPWKPRSRAGVPGGALVLTVGAEGLVRAVRTVLLPVAGVRDVDAAAVVALELVVGAAARAHCGHKHQRSVRKARGQEHAARTPAEARSPSAWCLGGSTVTEMSSELFWPPESVTDSLKV